MGNLLGFPEEQQPVDPVVNRAATSVRTSGRPAIESMAVHVKEVLPQVPIDVIRKDLMVTANVDETITRLLDGTVPYQAERKQAPASVPSASPSSSSASSSPIHAVPCGPSHPPLITAASTFAKTADERHRSFEERKKRLIDESRRRYLAKQELLQKQAEAVTAVTTESTN